MHWYYPYSWAYLFCPGARVWKDLRVFKVRRVKREKPVRMVSLHMNSLATTVLKEHSPNGLHLWRAKTDRLPRRVTKATPVQPEPRVKKATKATPVQPEPRAKKATKATPVQPEPRAKKATKVTPAQPEPRVTKVILVQPEPRVKKATKATPAQPEPRATKATRVTRVTKVTPESVLFPL